MPVVLYGNYLRSAMLARKHVTTYSGCFGDYSTVWGPKLLSLINKKLSGIHKGIPKESQRF